MKEITIDGIRYNLIPIKGEEFNDWRLPTVQELLTLVNYEKHNPPCNLKDTATNFYWSSSPFVSVSSRAWNVPFDYGYVFWSSKSSSNLVRCVRDSN